LIQTDAKPNITQLQDILGVTCKVSIPTAQVSICTTPVFSISPLVSANYNQ